MNTSNSNSADSRDPSSLSPLRKLLRQFLEHEEIAKQQSLKTLENYHHYLERFADWAEGKTSSDKEGSAISAPASLTPQDITLEHVHQYRLYLNRYTDEQGRTLAPKTQNYHLIALRAFLKYLAKNDIPSLAAEKIELGKTEKRSVEFLTWDEMERLFKAVDLSSRTGYRDRTILETLFSTGLRVSELVSLNRDQIDLNRREFMVRGKGKKPRIIFLSERCAMWLKRYLATRDDNWKPVFTNTRRHRNDDELGSDEKYRLTTVSVQNIVRKHAKLAGIIKKVTPHTIRHSFATNLLFRGADLRSVQDLLGHASITTTQIYTHLTDKKLREVHEKFHQKPKTPHRKFRKKVKKTSVDVKRPKEDLF